MDIVELIRNADSVPEVFAALSTYAESLRHVAVIPQWCLRMPVEDEADLGRRMVALIGVIDLTSRNLRDRDCNIAKHALQVFAAAAWRLRPRRNWRGGP